MEIRSGTSRYDDRGHPFFFIQLPHSVNKRCDRFFFPCHYPLHQFIADHKVCGTRILIDQKQSAACLDRLNYICRLRSASTCIFGIECLCIFLIREIVDEHRNVCLFDTPSIFRPEFDCSIITDHILSSISSNVIIHTNFQRI